MAELFVVGIGPGNAQMMTAQARNAILEANTIVGYSTYIDILKKIFPKIESEKKIISTPMTKEEERVRLALDAAKCEKTAIVCSGDAGVYGMASLALSLSADSEAKIEIVAGVTAAISGAALLGSPLSNDFATISLSDRLTPQKTIEKRLKASSIGDFCVALYNPRSVARKDALKNAVQILLEDRDKNTPCGWVQNVARNGENWGILPLFELADFNADMFSTIFIGNSQTKIIETKERKWLVTERGYSNKR